MRFKAALTCLAALLAAAVFSAAVYAAEPKDTLAVYSAAEVAFVDTPVYPSAFGFGEVGLPDVGGDALVPLRAFADALGIDIQWNAETGGVTALYNGRAETLSAGDVSNIDGVSYTTPEYAAETARLLTGKRLRAADIIRGGGIPLTSAANAAGGALSVKYNKARGYCVLKLNGRRAIFRRTGYGDVWAGDGGAVISISALTDKLGYVLSEPENGGAKLWEPAAFNARHGWTLLSDGYVAHAAGAYDGFAQLNAAEIMRWCYNRGWRVFEMDFCFTSDGRVAVVHDWDGYGGVKTAEQWEKIKLAGYFTTMFAEDVFAFMSEHPDMYLITDTKSYDMTEQETAEQMAALAAAAESAGVIGRVVPQIYNQPQYAIYRRTYPFNSLIYTLYADLATDASVAAFVADKADIPVVTMATARLNAAFVDALTALGKAVYTHTVNDPAEAAKYREQGVRGFYSDYLPLEWREEDPYLSRNK